jgi:hypothetical protein
VPLATTSLDHVKASSTVIPAERPGPKRVADARERAGSRARLAGMTTHMRLPDPSRGGVLPCSSPKNWYQLPSGAPVATSGVGTIGGEGLEAGVGRDVARRVAAHDGGRDEKRGFEGRYVAAVQQSALIVDIHEDLGTEQLILAIEVIGPVSAKGEAIELMLEVAQCFFRIRAVGQRTG